MKPKKSIKVSVPIPTTVKKTVDVRMPEYVVFRKTQLSLINEIAEFGNPGMVVTMDDTNGFRDRVFHCVYRLVGIRNVRRKRKRSVVRRRRR